MAPGSSQEPSQEAFRVLTEPFEAGPQQHEIAVPELPVVPDAWTHDAAAFNEVARAIAAAEACLGVLDDQTGLISLAVRDVMKAEMARAAALLQLLRFLKGDLPSVMTTASANAVVQRAGQTIESERRLRGIAVTTNLCARDVRFVGDDALVANVLYGLLLTTFIALEGAQNPEVTLDVMVIDQGLAISVTQEPATAAHPWTRRGPVSAAGDDPGGVFNAVAMSVAQRIARVSGGRVTTEASARSISVSIEFPSAQGVFSTVS